MFSFNSSGGTCPGEGLEKIGVSVSIATSLEIRNAFHSPIPLMTARCILTSTQRRRKYSSSAALTIVALIAPLCVGLCSGFAVSNLNALSPSTSLGTSPCRLYATRSGRSWRDKLYSGQAVLDRSEETMCSDEDDTHLSETLQRNRSDAAKEETDSQSENDTDQDVGESRTENEELSDRRKTAAARAALLAKSFPSKGRQRTTSSTPTSVGSRKEGSATVSRQESRATAKIVDVLRKTALGTVPYVPTDEQRRTRTDACIAPAHVSQSAIHSAIDEMLRERRPSSVSPISAAFSYFGKSMGILGDLVSREEKLEGPSHDCILEASPTDSLVIRLAAPADDMDIATLRMSVFSDFVPDLQAQFCARSCQAIAARRLRGATCLVATKLCPRLNPADRAGIILGSAECSFHEFFGTELGRRRAHNSVLYLTEVAVNPSFHRQGIGSRLLQAVDVLARRRRIETLYLHVDVKNVGALRLYEQAGYRIVRSSNPMYLDFTTSLNLHPGAMRGRVHYLLYKDLIPKPIWLDADENLCGALLSCPDDFLGIRIPA
jgi:ribosomal protein S18 acetylase RimI-like enzyme